MIVRDLARFGAVMTLVSTISASTLTEDWTTFPFDRGWVNWTGNPGTGDLGWNDTEGGYVFEEDDYPATGDAYYSLMTFGENVTCTGSFSMGSSSPGGQYELPGFGMMQDSSTYSFIYYDKCRNDLRFIKVINNILYFDQSPDYNLPIPSGAIFSIQMTRSGSDYQFILQYGSQGYLWIAQDTIGPSISQWYPAVVLRYLGSRCYSLHMDDDLGIPNDEACYGDSPMQATLQIGSINPNPFRSEAIITFHSPELEDVSLLVYNTSGRLVSSQEIAATVEGQNLATWDGCGSSGESLPNGVYFVRLVAGSESSNTAMVNILR